MVRVAIDARRARGGPRLNPRKADLQRWRERFAEYMTELGVFVTATRRQDRGLAKAARKTAIYRAAQRAPKSQPGASESSATFTLAGDSALMRKKLEAVKRELQAGGSAVDPRQYRSLLNVRAQVNERYGQAIEWLRGPGREEEARRSELLQRNLAPAKTENQLVADALAARGDGRTMKGLEPGAVR